MKSDNDWYRFRRELVETLRDMNRFDLVERDDFERRAWVAWSAGEQVEEAVSALGAKSRGR